MYVGDGAYVGDGGALLQRLWDLGPWRELRNCPGRYVSRRRELASVSPAALLASLGAARPPKLAAITRGGRDPIAVARFAGGGGLLAYVKADRYVHTLNTESGLIRKCEALRVPPSTFFGARTSAFGAVLAVLAFLGDADTNACAYALVRRFRRVPR